MVVVAARTWINENVRGVVTIVSDAEGVLSDLIKLKATKPTINNLAKELAMHLAPLGLELQGLHIWSERNELADALSRTSAGGSFPVQLQQSQTQKSTPLACRASDWLHLGSEGGAVV